MKVVTNQKGFTLLELLIALVILAIGLLGLAGLHIAGIKKMLIAEGNPVNLIIRNEKGMTLLMSLFMLVLLSIMGVAVINLSGTDLQTVAYEKMSTEAFSSAESGLTQARNDMQGFIVSAPQNGQWPANDATLVAGVMGGAQEKSYNLAAGDRSIEFAYTITDFGTVNDKTVLVTSTGTFLMVQQRIEAVIRYEPPDQTGAQECYNSKCTSVDQSSGTNVDFTGTPNSSVTL